MLDFTAIFSASATTFYFSVLDTLINIQKRKWTTKEKKEFGEPIRFS